MWIYSSGFPKSQDIGKSIERTNKKKNRNDDSTKWKGWGTALKPAHEPIALARKPMKTSIAQNCQKYGTGALNIDATRVPYLDEKDKIEAHFYSGTITTGMNEYKKLSGQAEYGVMEKEKSQKIIQGNEGGRFPSNVVGEILQEDYQKYFYCPKVSRRERHTGFELPPPMFGGVKGCYDENGERFAVGFDNRAEGKTKKKKHDPLGHIPTNPGGILEQGELYQATQARTGNTEKGNNHPTVKPVELMKYLIKLVTPPGGTVLDPFNGSGSTGMAAVELGHPYIGCELDPAYVEIAKKRIEAWINRDQPKPVANNFEDLFSATE
jgi:site-specific DNA-methyltransferase (adenine-specific)